jgi:hypothetical protein
MNVTREKIIQSLQGSLEDQVAVHALWLEGADASETVDQFSDIDVWIDVEDGQEQTVLDDIKRVLVQLSELDLEFEEEHPHPKIRQKFFHLKGTSKFLIIDVCIQSHSRVFWYTKGFEGEKVKILFDKTGVIQYKDMDQENFKSELRNRVGDLTKEFSLFQIWIEKNVARKNFLEALLYYHRRILEPLVELLRVKHSPTKRDYYLKHVTQDLPVDVVRELEEIYKVNSVEEIAEKAEHANKLFQDTLNDLDS